MAIVWHQQFSLFHLPRILFSMSLHFNHILFAFVTIWIKSHVSLGRHKVTSLFLIRHLHLFHLKLLFSFSLLIYIFLWALNLMLMQNMLFRWIYYNTHIHIVCQYNVRNNNNNFFNFTIRLSFNRTTKIANICQHRINLFAKTSTDL